MTKPLQSRTQQQKAGYFITFEGIDGTGKSTQIDLAVRFIQNLGHRVLLTREPGGTPAGEKIREILLASKTGQLSPFAELALMYAARAQLLDKNIRPALKNGIVVVSDRFNTASYAYQGFGRALGTKTVDAFDRVICGETQPDLTIVLDLDPKHAKRRALARGKKAELKLDRFEAMNRAFHQRVRNGYLTLARRKPTHIKVVDASQSIDEVHHEIRALIKPLLLPKNDKLRIKKSKR